MFIFKKKKGVKQALKIGQRREKKRQSVHQENADTNVIKAENGINKGCYYTVD